MLLAMLAAKEPLTADSLGQLPMSLVLSLVEDPAWPDDEKPAQWQKQGLPRENNVEPIWASRKMLEEAGLIGLAGGRFGLSARGRSLLKQGSVGELYARLFEARLRYGAGFPQPWPAGAVYFQRAMALHLSRLASCPDCQVTLAELATRVALPAWFYVQGHPGRTARVLLLLERHLLRPLEEFGLVSSQKTAAGKNHRGEVISLTPLFHEFLRFAA